MTDLLSLIKEYYDYRKLQYPPDAWQSLAFSTTELAEVYELLLDRQGGYVRNNPESKPKFSKERLAEELGDAIFMLLVTGIIEDVDPLQALENKMRTKMAKYKQATFISSVEVE
jgi:NTP pyrophosphatase (non-canonical NTP hydrolase)